MLNHNCLVKLYRAKLVFTLTFLCSCEERNQRNTPPWKAFILIPRSVPGSAELAPCAALRALKQAALYCPRPKPVHSGLFNGGYMYKPAQIPRRNAPGEQMIFGSRITACLNESERERRQWVQESPKIMKGGRSRRFPGVPFLTSVLWARKETTEEFYITKDFWIGKKSNPWFNKQLSTVTELSCHFYRTLLKSTMYSISAILLAQLLSDTWPAWYHRICGQKLIHDFPNHREGPHYDGQLPPIRRPEQVYQGRIRVLSPFGKALYHRADQQR